MSKHKLIIVESPNKINTITKYAGPGHKVKASIGHIKDLPKKELGIDVKNDFKLKLVVADDKKDLVAELRKAAKEADEVLIATDPDREGECIAQHLAQELKVSGKCRITFNEITQAAIKEALKNPREINQNKVNAQTTRRVLDRLVGYSISPILWNKVAPRTSAGRVQSAALFLICQKEREIRKFKSEKYWTVHATLDVDGHKIQTQVTDISGKYLEFTSEEEAQKALETVQNNAIEFLDIETKTTSRSPYAPFTTSTLQQACSSFYGMTAQQTMQNAQKLYEGIKTASHGEVALITYMRTDSTRSSPDSITSVRDHIKESHKTEYLSKDIRKYEEKKGKHQQDAHEAIRPTYVDITAACVADPYHKKVYDLIWKRFVASQMTDAKIEQTRLRFKAKDVLLEAKGSRIAFDGFLTIYPVKIEEQTLPKITKVKKISLENSLNQEHSTQPPKRYSEANLIKTLEKEGIGRPSTYATIVKNLTERGYATKDKGSFHLTEIGLLVNDELQKSFSDIINMKFTSEMEDQLDQIEEGHNWKDIVSSFYDGLKTNVDAAKKLTKTLINTNRLCTACQKPMIVKFSFAGRFLACSGYPKCKTTQSMPDNASLLENIDNYKDGIQITEDLTSLSTEPCPLCAASLRKKKSKFGEFWGCSGYPNCKYTKHISVPIVKCPVCTTGNIIEKKGKKKFYACDQYPECKKTYSYKPIEELCTSCDQNMVFYKKKNTCVNNECKDCVQTHKWMTKKDKTNKNE